MKLRPFAEQDFDGVVALWHETKRAAYPFLPLEQARTINEDRAFFREGILARYRVTVCESGGAVRGFLAMDDGGYIDRLYVDVRWQRRGIGRLLLDHAAARAPRGLRLFTHVENAAARAFYESLGFRAVRFGVSPPPESAPDVEYVRGDPPPAS